MLLHVEPFGSELGIRAISPDSTSSSSSLSCEATEINAPALPRILCSCTVNAGEGGLANSGSGYMRVCHVFALSSFNYYYSIPVVNVIKMMVAHLEAHQNVV